MTSGNKKMRQPWAEVVSEGGQNIGKIPENAGAHNFKLRCI